MQNIWSWWRVLERCLDWSNLKLPIEAFPTLEVSSEQSQGKQEDQGSNLMWMFICRSAQMQILLLEHILRLFKSSPFVFLLCFLSWLLIVIGLSSEARKSQVEEKVGSSQKESDACTWWGWGKPPSLTTSWGGEPQKDSARSELRWGVCLCQLLVLVVCSS